MWLPWRASCLGEGMLAHHLPRTLLLTALNHLPCARYASALYAMWGPAGLEPNSKAAKAQQLQARLHRIHEVPPLPVGLPAPGATHWHLHPVHWAVRSPSGRHEVSESCACRVRGGKWCPDRHVHPKQGSSSGRGLFLKQELRRGGAGACWSSPVTSGALWCTVVHCGALWSWCTVVLVHCGPKHAQGIICSLVPEVHHIRMDVMEPGFPWSRGHHQLPYQPSGPGFGLNRGLANP